MRAAQDFNYKVALASGLRSLQAGRLSPAEEQFRYLISRFPSADGGYRGLAKVQVELEDRQSALGTLRDGAAACSKAGERDVAIGLLREAVGLDRLDLSAHRRLAAALMLAARTEEAVAEYERFAGVVIQAGQPDLARRAVAYAMERFPLPLPTEILTLAARVGALADDGGAAAVALGKEAAPSEAPANGAPDDAVAEARAHLAAGRHDVASDLLLQLVAEGRAGRDAQMLLIDVARALGTSESARTKSRLLAQVLRLDGQDDLAREVEQLAQGD